MGVMDAGLLRYFSSNVFCHFTVNLRIHKPHFKVTALELGLSVLQRCISPVRFSFIAKFKYTLLLIQLFYSFVYWCATERSVCVCYSGL